MMACNIGYEHTQIQTYMGVVVMVGWWWYKIQTTTTTTTSRFSGLGPSSYETGNIRSEHHRPPDLERCAEAQQRERVFCIRRIQTDVLKLVLDHGARELRPQRTASTQEVLAVRAIPARAIEVVALPRTIFNARQFRHRGTTEIEGRRGDVPELGPTLVQLKGRPLV